MARGVDEAQGLSIRIEQLAHEQGDDYHAALMRGLSMTADTPDLERARDAAREHGDGYLEAEMTVALAVTAADADPVAAASLLADLTVLTTASGLQRLCHAARLATAMASRSTGDLRTCIELTTALLNDVPADDAADAVNVLGVASLLARDEQALQIAVHRALHLQRTSPGLTSVADNAQHRLDLLSGGPSMVDPYIAAAHSPWRITNATLWLTAREAIDAGAHHSAIRAARAIARDDPHGRALVAAITAAATGDENSWHIALHIAVEHNLRLIAVDALEGLAVSEARNDSSVDCLRLIAAAQRLRDETGYQWRFPFEWDAVESARGAALGAADADAADFSTGAAALDWRDAAGYASRARGRRKRPRHGWLSLTPTELQVARLVAEGRTNPQIAERLLMGRATVKTHLEHIFPKLGVTTRVELAALVARQPGTNRE
jgi:DNA-binding CsgD family transcriptional regulator